MYKVLFDHEESLFVEELNPSSALLMVPRLSFSRSPLTLPPWMLSQIMHLDPPSELDSEAVVRSRMYVYILLLLLVFSLNTNTHIPTSEECLAMPLYPYQSPTPKLCCTWFCLGQFTYRYFELKAGLVLLLSFYKGAC